MAFFVSLSICTSNHAIKVDGRPNDLNLAAIWIERGDNSTHYPIPGFIALLFRYNVLIIVEIITLEAGRSLRAVPAPAHLAAAPDCINPNIVGCDDLTFAPGHAPIRALYQLDLAPHSAIRFQCPEVGSDFFITRKLVFDVFELRPGLSERIASNDDVRVYAVTDAPQAITQIRND